MFVLAAEALIHTSSNNISVICSYIIKSHSIAFAFAALTLSLAVKFINSFAKLDARLVEFSMENPLSKWDSLTSNNPSHNKHSHVFTFCNHNQMQPTCTMRQRHSKIRRNKTLTQFILLILTFDHLCSLHILV